MKTVVSVVFLFFLEALHTQAQPMRDDNLRVRVEQLSYEKFTKSVEKK